MWIDLKYELLALVYSNLKCQFLKTEISFGYFHVVTFFGEKMPTYGLYPTTDENEEHVLTHLQGSNANSHQL
jgi:hypothetical protein